MVPSAKGHGQWMESGIVICCTWVSTGTVSQCRSSLHNSTDATFCSSRHFSCCLGDTLASELGILSKSPPILITNFKAVPPGTNGAVSIGGTLASVAGGVIMGATVAVTLVLENPVCRDGYGGALGLVLSLASLGGVAGGFGSLVRCFRFFGDLMVLIRLRY